MTGNTQPAQARIVDRGYKHYQGVRLGLRHALWAMIMAAMRRAMGIRRSMAAKALPWLLVVIPLLPVVLSLALRGLAHGGPTVSLISYHGIFGSVLSIYVLFAGYVAPDLLCADRRERVLSLYFASPITRIHYVLSQYIALASLLLLMTLAPALLLFAGNAVLSDNAATYIQDHAADLWHIVASGVLLALYFAAVALAVAAFTDRRAYASGAFIGLMLVSSAASNILSTDMRFTGHEWFTLLGLPNLPTHTIDWLFGATRVAHLDGWVYLPVTLAVGVVCLAFLTARYVTMRD